MFSKRKEHFVLARQCILVFLCHLLYRLDRIEISPTELESTDKDHPVPQEILDKLDSERYQRYIKKFEEMVEYIDSEKNPTGKFGFLLNF